MPTSARHTAFLQTLRRAAWSCCGAQNFCAALRRTLKILTAATRSPRFSCHWQRSVRSPHRPALPHPCKTPCHCEPVTDVTGVAIRPPRPIRRGRRPRRPAPQGFLLPSVGADASVRPPTLYRTPCKNRVIAKPVRTLAVAIRTPRPIRRGRRPRRPAPQGFLLPSVGADASVRPPALYRTPCKNRVIAKPVRTLAVAIRAPVPLAPLPKGGWHGKAVTGGFLPVLKPPARLRQNRIFSPSSTRLRMSARSSLVSPLGSLAVTAMLRPPFSATRPMPLARLPATCLRVRPAA